jgi:peptidylprolyl isomerase
MRFSHAGIVALVAAAAAAQSGAPLPAPPDVAQPPSDAQRTSSGLLTRVLQPGTGSEHPSAGDIVTVNYTGWTADGKMFDSSLSRGKPNTFAVNRVIPGFGEALQLMVTGERRRAWIPESLAYRGQREPRGTLVFDVELLDIPSRPPPDVKAPPPDAKKTPSGLAYKVLREGVGGRHPGPTGSVTVNYSGWTTDGKLFDSSVVRGQPATFDTNAVIAGWTEGLQLMVEGEKMRLWIPEPLAYKGQGPPYGMLVFDVELVAINR